jgi:hypothetical protein
MIYKRVVPEYFVYMLPDGEDEVMAAPLHDASIDGIEPGRADGRRLKDMRRVGVSVI